MSWLFPGVAEAAGVHLLALIWARGSKLGLFKYCLLKDQNACRYRILPPGNVLTVKGGIKCLET